MDDDEIIDFFSTFAQPNDDDGDGDLENIENELLRLLMGFFSEDGIIYNYYRSKHMPYTKPGKIKLRKYLKKELRKKNYEWFFENLPIEIHDCNGRPYRARISKIKNIRYAN